MTYTVEEWGENAWVELTARVCHEANREIQLATGDPAPSLPWDFAPNQQKASAIEGVIHAMNGQTPEQLHESWCDFKEKHGWVWGIHKDEKVKTHPCLVPYAELPPEQRLKDNIFQSIVRAFQDAVVLG